MRRAITIATALLGALVFAGAAGSAVKLHAVIEVVSDGAIPQGQSNGMGFSGSSVIPGLGKVSVSGIESEGCPYFWFCGKGFDLTLTDPNGDALHLVAGWREDCVPVLVDGEWRGETFCPGQTRNELIPMPADIPITSVSGTGRFADAHVTGSVSWSAVTEYPDFDYAYPDVAGTPITISVTGSLTPHVGQG